MAKYRKLIVAGLGLALLALQQFAGFELPYSADGIYTMVVSILTAAGVYQVPNA